ncbi:MAG: hypothetical protein ABI386_04795 [Rhodanobacter sp.]
MSIRLQHVLPLLLMFSLCSVTAMAQQPSTGLQQRMSSAEFKAAGLDKLSPQELQHLDHWLRTHAKVTTKVVDSSGKPVFNEGGKAHDTVKTRIVGPFNGWSKGQSFTMANTQQWEVTDPDPRSCRPGKDTEVKISHSFMNFWMMYVPSCYASVHVKRVR